jgi:hypothetical protein
MATSALDSERHGVLTVRAVHVADRRTRALGANRVQTKALDLPHWGWPEWYLVAQTALPALLYLPGTQAVRLPLRMGPFVLGFIAFAMVHNQRRRLAAHPSVRWLISVCVLLFLLLVHPMTDIGGGIAQIGLYLSVMLPVFWVPHLIRGPAHLNRLLWILLICSGVNATVGIMQVYNPAQWLPQEFAQLSIASYDGALSYIGAGGRIIVRPPGLFDTPGAACGPGAVAAVLGLVFGLAPELSRPKRLISLALAFAGVAVIYLTHVRANFVVALISASAFALVLFAQRRNHRAVVFLSLLVVVLVIALVFAVNLGGEGIQDRFGTLIAHNPLTVYYESRGGFLQTAFQQLLFDYPLGAGLGRWGMAAHYFGASNSALFAEIQPNGWIIDGGILLLLAYTAALFATITYEYHTAIHASNENLRYLAAIVVALNIGVIALTFSFVPFVSQVGIQFWFLAGALHGARHTSNQR